MQRGIQFPDCTVMRFGLSFGSTQLTLLELDDFIKKEEMRRCLGLRVQIHSMPNFPRGLRLTLPEYNHARSIFANAI
jgi:hypothetical protein